MTLANPPIPPTFNLFAALAAQPIAPLISVPAAPSTAPSTALSTAPAAAPPTLADAPSEDQSPRSLPARVATASAASRTTVNQSAQGFPTCPGPCPSCGRADYWLSPYGAAICERCTPPMNEAQVRCRLVACRVRVAGAAGATGAGAAVDATEKTLLAWAEWFPAECTALVSGFVAVVGETLAARVMDLDSGGGPAVERADVDRLRRDEILLRRQVRSSGRIFHEPDGEEYFCNLLSDGRVQIAFLKNIVGPGGAL